MSQPKPTRAPWRRPIIFFLMSFLAGCQDARLDAGLLGTLERDRIELIAEAQEPIVEIAAQEGEDVRAGQLLLRLDDHRYRALLAQARAVQERAAERLAELERGPRHESIEEGRARLAGAQARVEALTRDFGRVDALVARKLKSPAELDRARADRDAARADLNDKRAQLDAMLNGTTSEELGQAAAALDEARAAYDALQISADRLTVRASVAGTLDELPYKLGERPPAGGVVAVLLAADRPYARVYVPQAIRVRVTPGVRAIVHIDGIRQPLAGTVHYIARDAAFTPYFALTERERGRLSYLAEINIDPVAAAQLPTGIPVSVDFPDLPRN